MHTRVYAAARSYDDRIYLRVPVPRVHSNCSRSSHCAYLAIFHLTSHRRAAAAAAVLVELPFDPRVFESLDFPVCIIMLNMCIIYMYILASILSIKLFILLKRRLS